MLPRILRHEWRTLRAEHTLVAVLACFGLAVAWAVWTGASWAQAQRAEATLALAETQKEMDIMRAELREPPKPAGLPWDPNPRNARYVGGIDQNLVLPTLSLASLSVGQGDVLPARVAASIWTAPRMLARNYEIENPTALLSGRFDLAFTIVYLFPLLILALSYNLLSGEKEQGTLALLLSQPVALRTFVLGKVSLRFLVVAGLGAGLTLLGVLLSGVSPLESGVLPRLLLWALVVSCYGGFWFALAVLVNLRGGSSAWNAVVLAAAWLVLVVIVPALLSLGVSLAHPMPSRAGLVHAMREAGNDATKRGAQLLAKYFEDHPELAGQEPDYKDFVTKHFTVEQEVERAIAPVLQGFEQRLDGQIALVSRLRFLSPAVATQEALNEIAGTSPARYRRFREQALAFLESWKGFFLPRIYRGDALAAADYEAFPRFAFTEEAESASSRRVFEGSLGLLAPTLFVGLLAAARLRRYDVSG